MNIGVGIDPKSWKSWWNSMTRKNYMGICFMVMYGIRLAIASLSSASITDRWIDGAILLLLAYIISVLFEDKGN